MSRAGVATILLLAAAPWAAASTKVNGGPSASEPVVLAGPGGELIVFFKGSAGYSLARLDRHGSRVFGPSYVDKPLPVYSSSVAWSGSRIGWLYETTLTGNDNEIWFHTLDADGAMTSSPVPLNQAHEQPIVWTVRWLSGEFVAAYEAKVSTKLAMCRISEGGAPITSEILVHAWTGPPTEAIYGLDMGRVGDTFLATWTHFTTAPYRYIEGALYDLAGQRISPITTYFAPPPGERVVHYGVVSKDTRFVQLLNEWDDLTTVENRALEQIQIDVSGAAVLGPSEIVEYWLPIGGYVPHSAPSGFDVGWHHVAAGAGAAQVFVRRISEDGAVASPSFPGSDVPDGESLGSSGIAYNARAIGLAWMDTREGIFGEYDIFFDAVPAYETIVAGAGPSPSAAPRVELHQPESPGTAVVTVTPYGAGGYGANVGVAEIDGDDPDELLTGPGPGPSYGPQVRAFEWRGTPKPKVNFYAYGTLRYGVGVAGALLDADRYQEILTGAGPGAVFGPHVRGFTFDNALVQAMPKVSFFAYGTLRYGVNATAGNVDGDGYGEILTGPGPSGAFGAQLRGFDYDGTAVAAIAGINFFAFAGLTHGLHVASGDADFDDVDEIAAARGPNASGDTVVAVYGYDGGPLVELPGSRFEAFAGSLGGARLSFGQWDHDFHRELFLSRGPLPSSTCEVRSRDDAARTFQPLASFDPYPAETHGTTLGSIFVGF